MTLRTAPILAFHSQALRQTTVDFQVRVKGGLYAIAAFCLGAHLRHVRSGAWGGLQPATPVGRASVTSGMSAISYQYDVIMLPVNFTRVWL